MTRGLETITLASLIFTGWGYCSGFLLLFRVTHSESNFIQHFFTKRRGAFGHLFPYRRAIGSAVCHAGVLSEGAEAIERIGLPFQQKIETVCKNFIEYFSPFMNYQNWIKASYLSFCTGDRLFLESESPDLQNTVESVLQNEDGYSYIYCVHYNAMHVLLPEQWLSNAVQRSLRAYWSLSWLLQWAHQWGQKLPVSPFASHPF